MKLKDFLEIVYDHERLSIFNNDDNFDYLLHEVNKDEIIREHPELLDREIYYVNVHWYENWYESNDATFDDATLGVVLM